MRRLILLAVLVVGCNPEVRPNPSNATQGLMNYTDSTIQVEVERVFMDKPYMLTIIVRDGDKFVPHWVHTSPAATGALSIRTDVPADKPLRVEIGPHNHTVVLHVHSLSEIDTWPAGGVEVLTREAY